MGGRFAFSMRPVASVSPGACFTALLRETSELASRDFHPYFIEKATKILRGQACLFGELEGLAARYLAVPALTLDFIYELFLFHRK
jgi:hypothetical protein